MAVFSVTHQNLIYFLLIIIILYIFKDFQQVCLKPWKPCLCYRFQYFLILFYLFFIEVKGEWEEWLDYVALYIFLRENNEQNFSMMAKSWRIGTWNIFWISRFVDLYLSTKKKNWKKSQSWVSFRVKNISLQYFIFGKCHYTESEFLSIYIENKKVGGKS